MNKSVYLPSLIVLMLVGSTAFAQEQTAGAQEAPPAAISTDRPSFSAGSSTVPSGRLQLEGGLGFEYASGVECVTSPCPSVESRLVSAPNLLGRLGVADFAELRLGVPNMAFQFAGADSDPTFGSVSLGFKLGTQLVDALSVGMIGFASYGVDSGGGGAGGATAIADLSATDWLSFTVNTGVTTYELGGTEYAVSVLAAFALSDEVGTYVEWYGTNPGEQFGNYVDLGATLLVMDVQLDAYLGLGGAQTQVGAEHLFGGVGVSKLF
jgi:hypothetical protein